MKTFVKLTTAGLLTFILAYGTMSGQGQSSPTVKGDGKGIKSILTDQQQEMLKQRAAKQLEFRKDFRASVSQDQKDILDDPRVMPAERQRGFRASLTDQQVQMIKSHKAEMKKMREDFRATLTHEQETALKKFNMAGRMRSRAGFRSNPSFMPV